MKHSQPDLFIATSPREAWKDSIQPWFARFAPDAWKGELPALIIVPTRGHANALKARMIESGLSQLGLHFVTLTSLRALLARENATAAAEPEHLRLLLAIAASEVEEQTNEADSLAARAVARSPGPLLRTLDRLANAGWKFEQLQLSSFRRVVRRFDKLRARCGFLLPSELERQWLQRAASGKPIFSDVLITGFDGAHWPHWFLLRTAVALARKVTVVMEEPRGEFFDVDLAWIGSWEELCGEAKRASQKPGNVDALFSEAEMRGEVQKTERFDFIVGTNAFEQAEAITRQCVAYLTEEKCTRLGIIFPTAGALSRLVSTALTRLEIPHNDGIGHIAPGVFESNEWRAWLHLQRAPRLDSFLRFLNALPDPSVLATDISRPALEETLRDGYTEVLLDNLDVLREFCEKHTDNKFKSAGAVLRAIRFLPPKATFPEFLEQTHAALADLGWTYQSLEIANATRDWPESVDTPFSRALFLRWLEETAATFGIERDSAGDHPYARVQLLAVPHAQNQEWSHLVFAGWNEGGWPLVIGSEFARAEEIRAFNQSVQQLNKRATRQGNQGEGHISVRENHSLYLGAIEQRAIALRQFHALLDCTSEAVTIAASMVQEDAPERFWNPSESFTQLYMATQEKPLTQPTLRRLQRATTRWIHNSNSLGRPSAPSDPDLQQTLVAFKERRDSTKPSGEYDFALRTDGSSTSLPILSVSDLEQMVSSPAIIWMKRYLRVEAPEDTGNPWAATTGKWVHRWLASISEPGNQKLSAPFPSSSAIDKRVSASADERRAALERLCDSLGKKVPDWWTSGWLNARFLARYLGGKISSAKNWTRIVTELPIGRENAVKIAPEIELMLRGQIDLVFAQTDAGDFKGQNIWIVDYKTGSTKELKNTDVHDNLVKGTTLQLGFYALAMRELGATEVQMSIVSIIVKNVAPQLSVTELLPHANVFADLAAMQRTGVFGMKGEIRPAFGYTATYPLATLPIDQDILEDKWALTHQNLVLEKEEWEVW